jgi:cytochrome c oxidase cbb3-type subunit 1
MTTSPQSQSSGTPSAVTLTGLDASGRIPLLLMFIGAVKWLLVGSVFSLIASIKFHSPGFLADCSWLTYGRVRPAATNMMLYGFCLQAGLGIALWLFARLGRTRVAQSGLITIGIYVLNFGVLAGVLGILAGDSTGFDNLEMPRYGALLVFLGYLMIGIWAAFTFHQRTEPRLYPSQWFLLAALFWFPWIYSTANLLLVVFPVRGVAQSVLNWWYSNNLIYVWFGLIGLASTFYFLPKLKNRELPSQPLALFTFWALILFGSWTGIPRTAPVPAWIPAISTVATVLTVLVLITLALNMRGIMGGNGPAISGDGPAAQFIGIGVIAFFLGGVINILGAFLDPNNALNFTWLGSARQELQVYGFFVMTAFGAIYYLVPIVARVNLCPKLAKAHWWLALLGLILIIVPLAIGGIAEAGKLRDASAPFGNVIQATLPFLRFTTVGELLLFAGHGVLLANLLGLVKQLYCSRVEAAYANVTTDLFKSAEAKP